MAACDLDGARRDVKFFRQRAHKLFVGRSFDGRRCDAHAKRPVMLPHDPAARGARHDPHFKADPAICLFAFDQTLHLSETYGPKG